MVIKRKPRSQTTSTNAGTSSVPEIKQEESSSITQSPTATSQVKESKEPKETKETKEPKEAKEVKEARETKETKEAREAREAREAKAERRGRPRKSADSTEDVSERPSKYMRAGENFKIITFNPKGVGTSSNKGKEKETNPPSEHSSE